MPETKVKIYNHIAPWFSSLEREMVKHIPQWWNWKSIPESLPSKRLEQIRRTWGRTTLYWRLDWKTPSYTISTYFSRMWNWSFIHPTSDRLLSLREWARLQSFPDNYVFYWPKTSIYKQIWNAVPVLLARFLAEKLKNHISSNKIIDLFAWAWWMSVWFEMEGFESIAALEIDKNFMLTYKNNHPKSFCLEEDITLDNTKKKLTDYIGKNKVWLIVWWPPCQWFSLAWFRDKKDKRNQLYKDYLDVVKLIQPEWFVIENVPWILSMSGWKVNEDILKRIKKLWYYCNGPVKLNAHEYWVPQRRTRVFYIATKKRIDPIDFTPLYWPNSIKKKEYVTVYDAIHNLPKIMAWQWQNITEHKLEKETDFDKLMAWKISFSKFYSLCE